MRQWIGLAAVLALAGCGGGDGNDAGGNAAGGKAAGGESGAGGAVAMQPGQWEITTTVTRMNVPGMPAGVNMPMPAPTTVRSCLTAEQAAQPGAGFVTGSGESQGCTYQTNSMSGGRIQAVVQCDQDGSQMRSTISGQYAATSMEVTQQVEVTTGGRTMQMDSRTAGRRIGDCPAGAGNG